MSLNPFCSDQRAVAAAAEISNVTSILLTCGITSRSASPPESFKGSLLQTRPEDGRRLPLKMQIFLGLFHEEDADFITADVFRKSRSMKPFGINNKQYLFTFLLRLSQKTCNVKTFGSLRIGVQMQVRMSVRMYQLSHSIRTQILLFGFGQNLKIWVLNHFPSPWTNSNTLHLWTSSSLKASTPSCH